MTSYPLSMSHLAMILRPLSWESRPTLARIILFFDILNPSLLRNLKLACRPHGVADLLKSCPGNDRAHPGLHQVRPLPGPDSLVQEIECFSYGLLVPVHLVLPHILDPFGLHVWRLLEDIDFRILPLLPEDIDAHDRLLARFDGIRHPIYCLVELFLNPSVFETP